MMETWLVGFVHKRAPVQLDILIVNFTYWLNMRFCNIPSESSLWKFVWATRFRRKGCKATLRTLLFELSYDWSLKNGNSSIKLPTISGNRTDCNCTSLSLGLLRSYQDQNCPPVNESIQYRQTAAWGGGRETEEGEWLSEEEIATSRRGRL